MKAYVMTTGILFGLLTMAHVWRVFEEGRHLAALVCSHHACDSGAVFLGVATASLLDASVKRPGRSI